MKAKYHRQGWQAGALALATSFVLAGCAGMSETQRNTAIGAGVGAVAGGLIGDGEGAAIGAGVGALGGYVWSQYMENKRQQMQQVTAGTGVQVSQTQDNRLKLEIPNDISFDTGKSDIKPSLRPILDRFAQGLDEQRDLQVSIVGHADTTGSDAINDPLSVDRANSVADYLAARGVSYQRIEISGMGSRDPIASNDTIEGRAANRRVEVYLAEPAGMAQPPVDDDYQGRPIGTPIQ